MEAVPDEYGLRVLKGGLAIVFSVRTMEWIRVERYC